MRARSWITGVGALGLAACVALLGSCVLTSVAPSEGPAWNIWFEPQQDGAVAFDPRPALETESKYQLVVDLAALRYNFSGVQPGIRSVETSVALRQWLLSQTRAQAVLDVVVLPDERYFQKPAQPARLKVNLERLRRVAAYGGAPLEDPVSQLRTQQDAGFVFGRAVVPLETRHREGYATVTLSFWANGSLPVDEISVPICIGKCKGAPPTSSPLRNFSSLRVAAEDFRTPAAAVHLVQLNSTRLAGVFRCNTCGWPADRFETWQLKRDAAQLAKTYADVIMKPLSNAVAVGDSKGIRAIAGDFFRLIFEDGDPAREQQIRKTFEDFILQQAAHSDQPPGALFFRMIAFGNAPTYALPLGLMAVGDGPFVGDVVSVETPLPQQSYEQGEVCINNWAALLPSAKFTELNLARSPMQGWIDKLEAAYDDPSQVTDDLTTFRGWLEGTQRAKAGTGVLVISHHEEGKLFQNSVNVTPVITPFSIDRYFSPPALVMLGACESASPMSREFIEQFNDHNVHTIIATAAKVDATTTGLFFKYLGEQIEAQPEPKPLRDVMFRARQRLAQKLGENAAQAHLIMLMGDADVRLCMPTRREPVTRQLQ